MTNNNISLDNYSIKSLDNYSIKSVEPGIPRFYELSIFLFSLCQTTLHNNFVHNSMNSMFLRSLAGLNIICSALRQVPDGF